MKLITILLALAFVISCQHVEYVAHEDEDTISRAPASVGSEKEEGKRKKVRKQTYSQKYLKRKYEENLTE